MKQYYYFAVDNGDRNKTGQIFADDLGAAAELLVARGLVPIKISDTKISDLVSTRVASTLSDGDLIELFTQIRVFLDAGLPIDRACSLLSRTARSNALQNVASVVNVSLRDGATYADAFAIAVPNAAPHISVLLRAGEASGQLAKVLNRISLQLERGKKLKSLVVSALLYPSFVLATAIGAFVLISTLLVPQLQELFSGSQKQVPFAVQMLIMFNQLLHFGAVPFIGLAIMTATFSALKGGSAKKRGVRAVLFVANLFGGLGRKSDVAQFARLTGELLENGIVLDEAIDLASAAITDSRLSADFGAFRTGLREGNRLSHLMSRTKSCPLILTELVGVGEEASELPKMLIKAADTLDAELEMRLEKLKALLAPSLTLVIGVFVGAIVYLLLSALLSINDLAGL